MITGQNAATSVLGRIAKSQIEIMMGDVRRLSLFEFERSTVL